MEFTKALPPPAGPNCQINPVNKLSLWIVTSTIRFNIFLPSTAGLPNDFSFKHSQYHPIRVHFLPHTCHFSCPYHFLYFLYFDHTILIRSNKIQHYARIYLLQNHSTCFGFPSHPSSGEHKTITAASGTSTPFL
jgi:hypothetical protein